MDFGIRQTSVGLRSLFRSSALWGFGTVISSLHQKKEEEIPCLLNGNNKWWL